MDQRPHRKPYAAVKRDDGKLKPLQLRAGIGFRYAESSFQLDSLATCSHFVLMVSRDRIHRFAQPWEIDEEDAEPLVVTNGNGVKVVGLIIAQSALDTVWARSGCGVPTNWIINFDVHHQPTEKSASGANFQQIRNTRILKRYARPSNLAAHRFVDIKKSRGISGREWHLPEADRKPIPSL